VLCVKAPPALAVSLVPLQQRCNLAFSEYAPVFLARQSQKFKARPNFLATLSVWL